MERSAPPDPDLLRLPNVEYELRKEAVESAEMKRRLLHEPAGFVPNSTAQLATFWYIVETRGKSCFVGGFALLALSFAVFGWRRAHAAHPGVWVIVFHYPLFQCRLRRFPCFCALFHAPVPSILLILTALEFARFCPGENIMAKFNTVSKRVEELAHPDVEIRRRAARKLGEKGDVRAVQPLCQALHDEDAHVRRAAASALGMLHHPDAMQPLQQALKDRRNGLRGAAAWAIGQIGKHHAETARAPLT